jgi:hypothetical protein
MKSEGNLPTMGDMEALEIQSRSGNRVKRSFLNDGENVMVGLDFDSFS